MSGNAAHERVTSPVEAGVDAIPNDRDAASCVLFGEIAEASGFYDLFQFLARAKWRGELVVQLDDVSFIEEDRAAHVVAAQSQATYERIGEVLRRAGMLTGEQIDACVERQGDGSLRFGEAAVELGFITTEALFRAMDRQLETVFNAVVAATRGSFYFFLGYDEATLEKHLEAGTTFEDFFADAHLNPNASLITGVVCGMRVESIEDPLMQKIRYLDKLVDELAKGKPMEKVLRSA